MKNSEQIDKLAAALAKAQGALTSAPKQKTNPHFKSKYADLPALWEVSRKVLSDNGLALLQLPRHVPEGGICIETVLTHSSGQWIADDGLFVPATKQDAQGYGSAMTYARRYSMGAILGLVSDEDDDGNGASRPAASKSAGIGEKALADWLAAVETADTPETLRAVWSKSAEACREQEDTEAYATIKAAVTKRGAALKAAA